MDIDLYEKQIILEKRMATLGLEKFRKIYQESLQGGRATDSSSVNRIMMSAIEPLEQAIEAFLQEVETKKVGRYHTAAKYLKDVESCVASYITLKTVLDGISTDQRLTSTAARLGRYIEVEQRSQHYAKHHPDLLYSAKKRMNRESSTRTGDRRYASLSSTYNHAEFEDGEEDGWERWQRRDHIVLGLKLIELSTGIFKVVTLKRAKRTETLIEPTKRFRAWLDALNTQCEVLLPEYLPCVIEPKDWEDLEGGGYHTRAFAYPLGLVKTRSREHKKLLKQADLTLVYEAVNAVQRTAWRVNTRILEVANHLIAQGNGLAGLPEDDHQTPPRPDDYETNEDAKKAWRAACRHVYDKNASLTGQRIGAYKTLNMAREFADYEAIYFPHQLDFRGRIYPVVSYLQPQGTDLAKGLLEFSEGDPITDDEARDWLAIHGANCWGLDKVAFRERLQWVRENEQRIMEAADEPLDNLWWAEADSPFCFLAWCVEWHALLQAEQRGEVFISKIPVAMDGSCNGLQHYSAMLRDPVAGKAVNLLPSDAPQDIYATVAQRVTARLEAALVGEDEEAASMAAKWLEFGICRKITKRPVMVLPYGGTFSSCMDYVYEAVLERGNAPYPIIELRKAASWLASHVWVAIGEVVISARLAMDWLKKTARLAVTNGSFLAWEAPTGFPVYQFYPHREERRIDTALFGARFQPRYFEDKPDIPDKVRQTGGVAPNFVHSLDASALAFTVVEAHRQGMTKFAMIHDSYGTTAAQTARLAAILRDQFIKMYENLEALELFFHATVPDEAHKDIPPRPFIGGLDLNEIRASPYFFA